MDTFYAVFTIIEKLKGRGRTDQNGMAKSCQPLRKARERYCMIELRTMYTYELNDRYGDEYKTENTHINVEKKSLSLSRKHMGINPGSHHKVFCKLSPQKFSSKFNIMLDTNMRNVPNVIQTFLSSIRKSYLESIHEELGEVLKNKLSDFMFGQYYLQAIGFLEFKIYKQTRKKCQKTCVASFLITKVWSL